MVDTPKKLTAIKLLHTAVWGFFVACIVAIWVFAGTGQPRRALLAAAIVAVEVAVLAVNAWHCPLTSVAARYTADRRANFDIYLPAWLARHNQAIFGSLYVGGIVFGLLRCL